MRWSFKYYYFIFLYMYTKLWQYCIICSHAKKAILNLIEYIHTLAKIINATLLFLPPFFMSWTQRSKTFSMYTKGLFLSNIVHKSV